MKKNPKKVIIFLALFLLPSLITIVTHYGEEIDKDKPICVEVMK